MIRKIIIILSFLISINSYAKESTNLTIFAESNLALPLSEIVRKYSREKNTIVSINFSSSLDLISKIDEGDPADIFISSHEDWVKTLKQKGLIDIYSLVNIARDELVLITSIKNEEFFQEEIDLDNLEAIFERLNIMHYNLISDSDFRSLGRYSNEIIEKYHINPIRVFRRVNEDKKSMIDFVAEDNRLFALVLKSEILPTDNIKIVSTINDLHINYQASVIAGNNMDVARDFIKFLESQNSQNFFTD